MYGMGGMKKMVFNAKNIKVEPISLITNLKKSGVRICQTL
jgi:hypothetical protein